MFKVSNVSLVCPRANFDNRSEVKSSTQTPLNQTVNTGRTMGDLSKLARLAASTTLDRKLMENLIREKVGTKKMELEAIKIHREASKREILQEKKGSNNAYIREFRSTSTLMDLLNLKQKYAKTEEKRARGHYQREKKFKSQKHSEGSSKG